MTINFFFVVVLVIFALLMLLGYLRGILGIVMGALSWVFLFLFVNLITPQVYENIKGSDLEKEVFERTYTYLSDKVDQGVIEVGKSIKKTKKKDKLSDELFSTYGIRIPDELLTENVAKTIKENKEVASALDAAGDKVLTEVSIVVTDSIIKGMAMLITIVIGFVICMVATIIVQVVSKMPLIGEANRFAGLLFGTCEALLVVWVLMYVITVAAATDFGQSMMAQIDENIILKFLYDHNQILALV